MSADLGPKFGIGEPGIGEIVGHERSGTFARHLVALLDKQDVEQWAVGHDVLNPIHQLARRDAHVRGEDCGKSRLGLETSFGLTIGSVCRKTPFLEFEPASAVKFDPDLTGGFRVKWTWSATFGGKRRAGGDFGAHIGDFWKYRAWRAAGSPVRAALARFPGDVRQLFVAGT